MEQNKWINDENGMVLVGGEIYDLLESLRSGSADVKITYNGYIWHFRAIRYTDGFSIRKIGYVIRSKEQM